MSIISKMATVASMISFKFGKKDSFDKRKYDLECAEKKIVIIIPSYNNAKWCMQTLDSVRNQHYENFQIIYINDNSSDTTAQQVETYIKEHALENKCMLINNIKRVGAFENLYNAIYMCDNDSIVATLDGDDQLAHPYVLKILNSVYQDPQVWLTYGQFRVFPGGKIWYCTTFSDNTIKNNAFRKTDFLVSHLRTFYAGLFKLIKKEDLLYDGAFYPMSWDKAMMAPMIEMAGNRFKYIRDILYLYNNANPINDHKVDIAFQTHLNQLILQKRPYKPVDWQDVMTV